MRIMRPEAILGVPMRHRRTLIFFIGVHQWRRAGCAWQLSGGRVHGLVAPARRRGR